MTVITRYVAHGTRTDGSHYPMPGYVPMDSREDAIAEHRFMHPAHDDGCRIRILSIDVETDMPEIRVGDVIDTPTGIRRDVERFVVHGIRQHSDGGYTLRARYASNPRGVDWQVIVRPGEPLLRIVARGVARVDEHTRSLLPS